MTHWYCKVVIQWLIDTVTLTQWYDKTWLYSLIRICNVARDSRDRHVIMWLTRQGPVKTHGTVTHVSVTSHVVSWLTWYSDPVTEYHDSRGTVTQSRGIMTHVVQRPSHVVSWLTWYSDPVTWCYSSSLMQRCGGILQRFQMWRLAPTLSALKLSISYYQLNNLVDCICVCMCVCVCVGVCV